MSCRSFQLANTCMVLFCSLPLASSAYGVFLDGKGHYSLKGATETAPAMSSQTGMHQAIEQSFFLLGEARFSEESSFMMDLRLFDPSREGYLGDQPEPSRCRARSSKEGVVGSNTASDCEGRYQDTTLPQYQSYKPQISRAYVRYAFSYCLLEAGRRPREWGLGALLDAGNQPFAKSGSTFDGVTCHVNMQKTQTLGFSFGYDKLSETGTYAYHPQDNPTDTGSPSDQGRQFGASDKFDDIDQYFFSLEFDDRKANAGSGLTKKIGLYFANVLSPAFKNGGSGTDVKFLDLYTAFFLRDLVIQNELIFRMGRSGDPNYWLLGGASRRDEGSVVNRVQTTALTGKVDYILSQSGAITGPIEYRKGNLVRHVLGLDYVYAPGDADGYHDVGVDGVSNDVLSTENRDSSAKAFAFHPNFKPALIFFNGKRALADRAVDGVFFPDRVMNVNLLGFAYRYESFETGNFEAKFITGKLQTSIPAAVKSYYDGTQGSKRPIGTYGSSLGYELDLKYWDSIDNAVDLGAAVGLALPGDAWKVDKKKGATNNMLIETFATFKF